MFSPLESLIAFQIALMLQFLSNHQFPKVTYLMKQISFWKLLTNSFAARPRRIITSCPVWCPQAERAGRAQGTEQNTNIWRAHSNLCLTVHNFRNPSPPTPARHCQTEITLQVYSCLFKFCKNQFCLYQTMHNIATCSNLSKFPCF